MRELDGKIVEERLLRLALQAVRRYAEAKGVKPLEEIEHLRLEAEALISAASEYQLRAQGGPVRTLH